MRLEMEYPHVQQRENKCGPNSSIKHFYSIACPFLRDVSRRVRSRVHTWTSSLGTYYASQYTICAHILKHSDYNECGFYKSGFVTVISIGTQLKTLAGLG